MTHLEAAIKQLLLQDSRVSAILGNRIFTGYIPENTAFPALYFMCIHDAPHQNMSTVSRWAQPVYQFEYSSPTYAELKTIRAAVLNCLLSYRGSVSVNGGTMVIENIIHVDGKGFPFDPNTRLFTWQSVLKIQHQEDISIG